MIFLTVLLFLIQPGTLQGVQSDNEINWVSLEEAQTRSAEDGKPVVVFVEAEWCGICKEMRRSVFPNDEVKSFLEEKYHMVSIDLDSRKEVQFNKQLITERQFARSMGVEATPTLIFLDSNGEELGRRPGYLGRTDMKRLLEFILSDKFGVISFEEYQG
ncbi:MAG: thioredoxin family protein [Bacteroidota bacterium]